MAAGTALVFNGVANQFYSTRLPFRDDCLSHETYPQPLELDLGHAGTVSELFAKARPKLEGPLELVLDRELVVSIECPRCSWRTEVLRPRVTVKSAEAICPNCQQPARPNFASSVDESSPLVSLPLSRVGIPPYDIVRVDGPWPDRDSFCWPPTGGMERRAGDHVLERRRHHLRRNPCARARTAAPARSRPSVRLSGVYQVPAAGDLPIFLDRRAADLIERHALSDTSVELGGILLGKECLDQGTGEPFVWINHSIEAKHYANTQASFTYTHDSWEEITRERDQRFPDFDIVGWYHTHPSFGIFLSHHDLFIHQNFFAQPLHVAYVVDPINQTRGFFQWRNGGMAQVGGYYVTADRTDRVALAKLVNDLEQIPNPEGSSGGGLSPRLEAELIKMLTRPAQRDISSPVEKPRWRPFSALLGMVLGVVAVAAVLGLYQLRLSLDKQSESIQALADQVDLVDLEPAARE